MLAIFMKLRGMPFFRRGAAVIALVVTFLPSVVPGEAAEIVGPEANKASTTISSSSIPVVEVAPQAVEASNLIFTFASMSAPGLEIEMIQKSLPEVSRHIGLELAETTKILQKEPTFATLQTQEQLWRRTQLQTNGWLKVLTQRAIQLQNALDRLSDLQMRWTSTRDSAQASKESGDILQQIDGTLAAIQATQTSLKGQRTVVLDLQSRVAFEVERCVTVLAQIDRLQKRGLAGIFVRDSQPIWSAKLWTDALSTPATSLREVAEAFREDMRLYAREPSQMPLHAGIFVALTFVFWAARRRVYLWEKEGMVDSSVFAVFQHPYAMALVVSIIISFWTYLEIPPMARQLLRIVAIPPIILLLRPVVGSMFIPLIYMLGILYCIDQARQTFVSSHLIGQAIVMSETVAGMVVVGLLLKSYRSHKEAVVPNRLRALRLGTRLVLFILFAALLAGVLGYMRMAGLVVGAILTGGAVGASYYAAILILVGVIAFLLRLWPLRALQVVAQHRALLERRVYHFLILVGIVAGLVRIIYIIGLFTPVLSFLKTVLSVKLEAGSISISIGDIVAFFLTVLVAYLLSTFIRFVLQEDVYPRMGIAPGQSYALSSLLHYLILALGFVVGIGILGVNLTRVTVLAGAFGVGIGFGLQSVVNNFVSGLILLFEQPIHVGDTVEVGDLLGKVRKIGIRASTVHTWQGADIVVPNSEFISEKVTNWTLSDQLRRIDLPVGVNYGATPIDVIKVLEAVARANPRVLKYPEPLGLFIGYGDSSINFELRAWTDQFDDWIQIRSDLAVAVYDAVHAAGMTFPFPQREVRLLANSDGRSTIPPVNPVDKE
jgi:potassium-dependent mechanosensitive channel